MGTRKVIQQSRQGMGTPAFVSSLVMACVVVVTGAVYLGKSDRGEINVAATIQNSNQANVEAGGDSNDAVNSIPETFRNMPNGGLVSSESQGTETIPPNAPEENTDSGTTSTSTVADGAENTPTDEDTVSDTNTSENTENATQ